MATTLPIDVPLHLITTDLYHGMVEAGLLGRSDRVELIEGVLVEMSPISEAHQRVVDLLNIHFAPAMVARTAVVRIQGPITRRDDRSEPEPDVLVIAQHAAGGHPDTALLVVEVAVTSHKIDRVLKAPIYARAGIPEYWLIDLPGAAIEVRTDPGSEGYATMRTVRPGDQLEALAVPDTAPLDVAALLASPS